MGERERAKVLPPADDTAVLDLVGDVSGVLDVHEFGSALLAAVRRAVPADWVSVNDLGSDPDTAFVLIDPPFPRECARGVRASGP